MPPQTATRAAESDLEPAVIYKVLADAENLPLWAPAFADAVERMDEKHFRITKSSQSFNVEVFLHPSALAVDYIREMSDNRRGGAYLRITPRPLGGSSIAITVPLAPGVAESDAATTLEEELAALIRLAQD